jgi:hypothetical protein
MTFTYIRYMIIFSHLITYTYLPSTSHSFLSYSLIVHITCFLLDFTYERKHITVIFLSLIVLLNMMTANSIHFFLQMAYFVLLNDWIILYYMCFPHFLYPFIHDKQLVSIHDLDIVNSDTSIIFLWWHLKYFLLAF